MLVDWASAALVELFLKTFWFICWPQILIHRWQGWTSIRFVNQNTQEVKNEPFLMSTRQTMCTFLTYVAFKFKYKATDGKTDNMKHFQTRSLRGWKHFNCDLQQWHWDKCLIFSCFISVCLSVTLLMAANDKNVNIVLSFWH